MPKRPVTPMSVHSPLSTSSDHGVNSPKRGGHGASYFQNCLLIANLLLMTFIVAINCKSLRATGSDVLVGISRKASAIDEVVSDCSCDDDKKGVSHIAELTSKGAARVKDWVHNEVVYGLVHIAKTAGTEINGMLANKYDRVCGNKGYSFDALEASKRWGQYKAKHNFSDVNDQPPDFIHKHTSIWGRMRVSWALMQERGFDNCDYIAHEEVAPTWNTLFAQHKMEVHVPCRDPLSHLMSSCNFQKQLQWVGHEVVFNCDAPDLVAEIRKCKVLLDDRLNEQLNFTNHKPRNRATMKCFDPIPPQRYVNYMGNFLQRRRTQGHFVHIDTNTKRNKENECVWKQSKEWQDNLIRLMRQTHFYYRFCGECMGSQDELPLPEGSPKKYTTKG